jgi:hypothetical protein
MIWVCNLYQNQQSVLDALELRGRGLRPSAETNLRSAVMTTTKPASSWKRHGQSIYPGKQP